LIRAQSVSSTRMPRRVHYAGIVVVVRPGELEQTAEALGSLPGVEVHFRDPDGGRLVVVQEAGSARAQEEGFRRIEALPGVATAALVEYRVDQPAEAAAEPGGTRNWSTRAANGGDR